MVFGNKGFFENSVVELSESRSVPDQETWVAIYIYSMTNFEGKYCFY